MKQQTLEYSVVKKVKSIEGRCFSFPCTKDKYGLKTTGKFITTNKSVDICPDCGDYLRWIVSFKKEIVPHEDDFDF
jgi:NAD-dependent SIR2 family protein deacetylase